jgi:hypothetical protein
MLAYGLDVPNVPLQGLRVYTPAEPHIRLHQVRGLGRHTTGTCPLPEPDRRGTPFTGTPEGVQAVAGAARDA